MVIRYRISARDFMAAYEAHWSARHIGTRANLIAGALALLLSGAVLPLARRPAWFLAATGLVLLGLTGLRLLIWRKAYQGARKYQAEIVLTIAATGVRIETAHGRSELTWDFFSAFRETSDYLLLYLTRRTFSIIPQRAFPDAATRARALALVRQRLADENK